MWQPLTFWMLFTRNFHRRSQEFTRNFHFTRSFHKEYSVSLLAIITSLEYFIGLLNLAACKGGYELLMLKGPQMKRRVQFSGGWWLMRGPLHQLRVRARSIPGVGFLIFTGLTVSLNRSTHFIWLVVTDLVFTISCFTMQDLYFDCQVQFIAEVFIMHGQEYCVIGKQGFCWQLQIVQFVENNPQ